MRVGMSSTRGPRRRSTPPALAFSSGVTVVFAPVVLRGAGFPAVVGFRARARDFAGAGRSSISMTSAASTGIAHLSRSAFRFRRVGGKSALHFFVRLSGRLRLVCVHRLSGVRLDPVGRHTGSRGWDGCTRKHANLTSSVAFEADEPFALKHAQKLHDRGHAPFALVESPIHRSNELLPLPHVHRPAGRLRGAAKYVARVIDDLLHLFRIAWQLWLRRRCRLLGRRRYCGRRLSRGRFGRGHRRGSGATGRDVGQGQFGVFDCIHHHAAARSGGA